MRGPDSYNRPSYPGVKARIGEDPARYLASSMDVSTRIRGIADLGVVNGWLQVARDLDVGQEVIEQLERRRSYLIDRERRIATDGGEHD